MVTMNKKGILDEYLKEIFILVLIIVSFYSICLLLGRWIQLYLNKKGEMMRVIVVAIPVIIVAGILFFATATILNLGESSVDREACRNSVLLKERSKVLGKPFLDSVRCETNLIEIDSDDEDEIFRDITNEMYDCWYQFGEGKRDFLSDRDFGGGDEWCFVCSRIEFGEETQKEVSEITMSDFNNFLNTEIIPFSGGET